MDVRRYEGRFTDPRELQATEIIGRLVATGVTDRQTLAGALTDDYGYTAEDAALYVGRCRP